MLLWLFFVYFVGKSFYDLAQKHRKNGWLFAILGIVSYYASILLAGFILGTVVLLMESDILDDISDTTFNLIELPIGILACWGFYRILKYNWQKAPAEHLGNSLDSGFIVDQSSASEIEKRNSTL